MMRGSFGVVKASQEVNESQMIILILTIFKKKMPTSNYQTAVVCGIVFIILFTLDHLCLFRGMFYCYKQLRTSPYSWVGSH